MVADNQYSGPDLKPGTSETSTASIPNSLANRFTTGIRSI